MSRGYGLKGRYRRDPSRRVGVVSEQKGHIRFIFGAMRVVYGSRARFLGTYRRPKPS